MLDLNFSRPPPWLDQALCAQTDPEAFYPEKGGSTRDAKRICLRCDVRAPCLVEAIERDERFGIRGGYSERERRQLAKNPRLLTQVLDYLRNNQPPPPLKELAMNEPPTPAADDDALEIPTADPTLKVMAEQELVDELAEEPPSVVVDARSQPPSRPMEQHDGLQPSVVREGANREGIVVSETGPIQSSVIDAYMTAHQTYPPLPKGRVRKPSVTMQLLEANGLSASDVRNWALDQGMDVYPKGVPSLEIVRAYLDEHQNSAA